MLRTRRVLSAPFGEILLVYVLQALKSADDDLTDREVFMQMMLDPAADPWTDVSPLYRHM